MLPQQASRGHHILCVYHTTKEVLDKDKAQVRVQLGIVERMIYAWSYNVLTVTWTGSKQIIIR